MSIPEPRNTIAAEMSDRSASSETSIAMSRVTEKMNSAVTSGALRRMARGVAKYVAQAGTCNADGRQSFHGLPPDARLMLHAGHAVAAWTHWGGDAASAAGLAATAALYATGLRRVWRQAGAGHGVSRAQAVTFASALAVLAIALLSPIDALSGQLFSAHMAQHVLLAVVAPPLLVAGAPTVAMAWALPRTWRRAIPLAILRQRWLVRPWRAMTLPFAAALLHAIALWSWHAPRLYSAALQSAFVHFLEHFSFVATAALIWWSILRPRQPRRVAYATGILVLFITAMHSGALGALLTLSRQPWFPLQGSGARAFGLTPLEDQQLAGLIMWVPAGFLYLGAMAALFAAWMRQFGGRGAPAGVATSTVGIART